MFKSLAFLGFCRSLQRILFASVLCIVFCGIDAMALNCSAGYDHVEYDCGAGSGTPLGERCLNGFWEPNVWPSPVYNTCSAPGAGYTFDGYRCCTTSDGICQYARTPTTSWIWGDAVCTALWATDRSGAIILNPNRYASANASNPVQTAYSGGGKLWRETPSGTDFYELHNYSSNASAWFTSNVITQVGVPAMEGWQFNGYYTGKDATGALVVDSNGDIVPSATSYAPSASGGSTTWYASWTAVPVNLQYDCGSVTSNGTTINATPSGSGFQETYYYGDSYTLKNATWAGNHCSLPGYTFADWECYYTSPNPDIGTQQITNTSGTWTFGDTVTCTARWRPNNGAMIFLDSVYGLVGGYNPGITDTLFVQTGNAVFRSYNGSTGVFSSSMDPLPHPTNMVTPPSPPGSYVNTCYVFAGYYKSADFDSPLYINSYGELTAVGEQDAVLYNSNQTWYGLWGLCWQVIVLNSTSADDGGHGSEFVYYKSVSHYISNQHDESPYLHITNCSGSTMGNCTFTDQMTTSAHPITIPTRANYTFAGYYSEQNGQGLKFIDHQGYITDSGLQAVSVMSLTNSDYQTNVWYAHWCEPGYWVDNNGNCVNTHCQDPRYPFWDSARQKCYWVCPDKGSLLTCPDSNYANCQYVDPNSDSRRYYEGESDIPTNEILCETDFTCSKPSELVDSFGQMDPGIDANDYGLDAQHNDMFWVRFDNPFSYKVEGQATCRDFIGNNYNDTWLSIMYMWTRPTSALSITSGKYCWCQITGVDNGNYVPVASGLWTFIKAYNSMATCESECTVECARGLETNSAFRERMFNSAKYCALKYGVLYDCNNGNNNATYSDSVLLDQVGYSFQDTLDNNLSCSKPGYTATGLLCTTNTNQTTVTQSQADPWSIQDDVTCKVQWEIRSFNVIYENGGHGTCSFNSGYTNPSQLTCAYGSTCSVQSSIIDCSDNTTGYQFTGWNCNHNVGALPANVTWNFEDNLTCTAQWTPPPSYSVTYDCGLAGAGTNNTTQWAGPTFMYPASSNLSLASSVTTEQCDTDGRTFYGWDCVTAGNSPSTVTLSGPSTISAANLPASDIICTAQWQAELDYNCNNSASGAVPYTFAYFDLPHTVALSNINSITWNNNQSCTAPTGHAFGGWYCFDWTAQSGVRHVWNGSSFSNDNFSLNHTTTCYAIWKENPLVCTPGDTVNYVLGEKVVNDRVYGQSLNTLFNSIPNTQTQSQQHTNWYDVTFSYGTVQVAGFCSSTDYPNVPGLPGEPNLNSSGNYCWCQAQTFTPSGAQDSVPLTGYPYVLTGNISNCTNAACAAQCASISGKYSETLFKKSVCEYHVAYDCDNSNTIASESYETGASYQLANVSGCDPYTGYQHVMSGTNIVGNSGWICRTCTDADDANTCSNTYLTNASGTWNMQTNYRCVAQWEQAQTQVYSVSYTCGSIGGNVVAGNVTPSSNSSSYAAGTTNIPLTSAGVVDLSDCSVPSGYSFNGWKCPDQNDNTLTVNKLYLISTMPSYNVTCEAQWALNNVLLEWEDDNNQGDTPSANGSTQCNYGGGVSITVPSTPTKQGYLFNGWKVTNWDCNVSSWNAQQYTTVFNSTHSRWKPSNVPNGYTMQNQFGTENSSDLNYGEWALMFTYGDVKGMSKCSETNGGTNAATGTPSDTIGQYCWCKVTNFTPNGGNQCNVTSTPWVFAETALDTTVCQTHCAYYCASKMNILGYRSAAFNQPI